MRRRNFLRRVLGIVGCSAFVTPFVDAKYPENDIQHCCSSYDVPHGIHVSREQLYEMIRVFNDRIEGTDISVQEAFDLAEKAFPYNGPCFSFTIAKFHFEDNRWDVIRRVHDTVLSCQGIPIVY